MRDQATLLEQLRSDESFGRLFTHLSGVLLAEGRVYPLSTLALSGSASVLGTDAPSWQVARFLTSYVCVVLTWVVLRRCGATVLAATLGASLFAVAGSAAHTWTYTMALEGYGLPFLLGAFWMAAEFHNAARPRRAAATMSALLLLAIFAKETFIACAPSVLLLALCHRGGGVYGSPQIRIGRNRVMTLAFLGIVGTFGLLPAIVVKSLAPAGYASGYSVAHVTWAHAGILLRAFFSVATWAWLFPANLLFWLVVGAGIIAGYRRNGGRTTWVVVVALLLPVAGWILYLPWRFSLGYYAVPYLFGLALLLANAVSELERGAPRRRVAGLVVIGMAMVASAALVARNGTAQFQAESFVEGEAAAMVAKMAPRTLRVAAPAGIGWVATDMSSYVKGYGGPETLTAAPIACGASRQPGAIQAGSVLVEFSHICPGGSPPDAHGTEIRRSYSFLDWKRWRQSQREASAVIDYGKGRTDIRRPDGSRIGPH